VIFFKNPKPFKQLIVVHIKITAEFLENDNNKKRKNIISSAGLSKEDYLATVLNIHPKH
jgi:hypothetical protein